MSRTLYVTYNVAGPFSGRRSHWSLFLPDLNTPVRGTIYEDQGELLQMTYGRVESIIPEEDITYRGRFELCTIPEDKVEEFENIAEGMELPSSLLRVSHGDIPRDRQNWVADVIDELVT